MTKLDDVGWTFIFACIGVALIFIATRISIYFEKRNDRCSDS